MCARLLEVVLYVFSSVWFLTSRWNWRSRRTKDSTKKKNHIQKIGKNCHFLCRQSWNPQCHFHHLLVFLLIISCKRRVEITILFRSLLWCLLLLGGCRIDSRSAWLACPLSEASKIPSLFLFVDFCSTFLSKAFFSVVSVSQQFSKHISFLKGITIQEIGSCVMLGERSAVTSKYTFLLCLQWTDGN